MDTAERTIRAIRAHVDNAHARDVDEYCPVCTWTLTQNTAPDTCARCGRQLTDSGHAVYPAGADWHAYIAQDTAARILSHDQSEQDRARARAVDLVDAASAAGILGMGA